MLKSFAGRVVRRKRQAEVKQDKEPEAEQVAGGQEEELSRQEAAAGVEIKLPNEESSAAEKQTASRDSLSDSDFGKYS